MGIHVFFFTALFFFFFSHARIGLLVEPGREAEKLIIVPLPRKTQSTKRAKSGLPQRNLPILVRRAIFPNFSIRASSILKHLRHDLLLIGVKLSYRNFFSLIIGFAMAPKRRGKKLVFSVGE